MKRCRRDDSSDILTIDVFYWPIRHETLVLSFDVAETSFVLFGQHPTPIHTVKPVDHCFVHNVHPSLLLVDYVTVPRLRYLTNDLHEFFAATCYTPFELLVARTYPYLFVMICGLLQG